MFSNTFGLVFYQLINLYITYVLALNLSVSDFGEYQFYLSISFFLVMILKAGIDEGLVYLMPRSNQSKENNKAIISSLYLFYFFVFISIFLTSFIWKSLFNKIYPEVDYYRVYFITASFFLLTFASATLRVIGANTERVFGLYVLAPLIMCFLIAMLHVDVNNVLDFRIISFLVSGLVLILLLYRKNIFTLSLMNKGDAGSLLKISLSIFVLQFFLSGVEQNYIAIALLKKYASSDELGLYSFAIRYAALLAMVVIAFNGFLVPVLVRVGESNCKLKLREVYVSTTRVTSTLNLISFLFLYGFSQYLITWIDPKYMASLSFVKILLFANFSTLLFGLNIPIVNSFDKKWEFKNIFCTCIFMLLSSMLLLKFYGALGIAVSALLAQFLMNFARSMRVHLILGLEKKHHMIVVKSFAIAVSYAMLIELIIEYGSKNLYIASILLLLFSFVLILYKMMKEIMELRSISNEN
ncbi:hypothetical protein [Endozoicomonas sp. 8E]|uniref:lipopolysaccharide biosynthesis protein n=1 Tax=Endozoicomonas sp. 8E TaxID=3035692 RepID=UPI002938F1E5|nr:hypothetical protein [Endozoicomonas sp. 8E]WOG25818.1 hypothetical protein P6910_14670 [Endozoicomonas sp. 8E]